MLKKAALLLSTLLLAGCGTNVESISNGGGFVGTSSTKSVQSSVVSSQSTVSSDKSSSSEEPSKSVDPVSSVEPSISPAFYTTFEELYPWVSDVALETVSGIRITEGYKSPIIEYETMEIYTTQSIIKALYYISILDIPLTRAHEYFDDNTYQIVTYLMSNGEEHSITFYNDGYLRVDDASYYLDLLRVDLLNIEFDVSEWIDFDGLFTWVEELFE